MPKVKVRDIEMYYEIYGEGEPLVLIMGLGMDLQGWIFQVPEFVKHFKVLIFDNRGIGKTDAPAGPYSTKMMADDTVELMRVLNIEKANILGISMGGMIAQELAINYSYIVKKLVLACTYAKPDKNAEEIIKKGILQLAGGAANSLDELKASMFTIDFEAIMRFMLPFTLSDEFIKQNKEVIDEMFKKVLENKPTIEGFLGQVRATQEHNAMDRLNKISAETLVITGDKDILVAPENSKVLSEKIPNAKLIIIPEGTHGFNWEQKDEFNSKVIEFLK